MSSLIGVLTNYQDNNELFAAQLRSDFSEVRTKFNTYALLTDQARTVTGVLTFDTAPVINGTLLTDRLVARTTGLLVQAGGAAVTGDSSIAGALAVAGPVAVSGFNITTTDNVQAQGNIIANNGIYGAAGVFSGNVNAVAFFGSGAGLTSIAASGLTGTLPALNGSALTALNASAITSGTLAAARLPTTGVDASSLTTGTLDANRLPGALNAFTAPAVTLTGLLSLARPGSADTLELFDIGSGSCFSTVAPTGSSIWLRVRNGSTIYKVLAQVS